MRHHESKINVNNEWRSLLVLVCDEAQVFPDVITIEEESRTLSYHTSGIYRQFEEDGKFIYWFLPTLKETIKTVDTAAREEAALLEEQLTDTQLALCEQYEEKLVLEEQLTDTQLALCDVYELVLGGE